MGFIRKKKASSFHIVKCCYQNPYSPLFCFKSLYGRFQAHDSFLRTVKSKNPLFLTLSSLSTDVTVTSVTDLGTETRRRFTLLSFSLSLWVFNSKSEVGYHCLVRSYIPDMICFDRATALYIYAKYLSLSPCINL